MRFFIAIHAVLLLSATFLTACTSFNTDHSSRVCKALTNDIVFQPATSNIRRAEIADTNLPLAERDYDADNCKGT